MDDLTEQLGLSTNELYPVAIRGRKLVWNRLVLIEKPPQKNENEDASQKITPQNRNG